MVQASHRRAESVTTSRCSLSRSRPSFAVSPLTACAGGSGPGQQERVLLAAVAWFLASPTATCSPPRGRGATPCATSIPSHQAVLGPRLAPIARLRGLVCPATAAAEMLGLATDTEARFLRGLPLHRRPGARETVSPLAGTYRARAGSPASKRRYSPRRPRSDAVSAGPALLYRHQNCHSLTIDLSSSLTSPLLTRGATVDREWRQGVNFRAALTGLEAS